MSKAAGAAGPARCELAAGLLAGLRQLDGQRREVKKKLAAAVNATGTTVTAVFGAGPVIAATVIGDVVTVARFPARGHFAAYHGTPPVEVSSGATKVYRLSLRGNRRLNHAIHMAAITQISHAHSDGRGYYERKIAEGKTHKQALRCLQTTDQRRHLRAAARRRPHRRSQQEGPGRATGERLCLQGGRLPPQAPALRTSRGIAVRRRPRREKCLRCRP